MSRCSHRWVFWTLSAAVFGLAAMVTSAPAGDEPKAAPMAKIDPKIRDVAGSYYAGDGLGWNPSLTIQADGRYTYKLTGCLGTYDTAAGTVRVEGDFLVFTRDAGQERKGYTAPTACLPVRWGNRRYLVAKDEIPAFCAAVNDGTEPRERHGTFYLRDGDWKAKPAGLPELPKPWRDQLKPKPGEGTVASARP